MTLPDCVVQEDVRILHEGKICCQAIACFHSYSMSCTGTPDSTFVFAIRMDVYQIRKTLVQEACQHKTQKTALYSSHRVFDYCNFFPGGQRGSQNAHYWLHSKLPVWLQQSNGNVG